MSAAITTLQNSLRAAIEAAVDAETFALPVCVRVADSSAKPPPTPDEPFEVVLSFEATAQLARSSTRVLDQHLVSVTLSYRHPDNDQGNLDQCHLIAEQLRDLLGEYASPVGGATGLRVEQILTPHPFDEGLALAGVYSSRFVLDCDVLRRLHTHTAPSVGDSPRLSAIRGAVWDSIDNWPAFTVDDESVWTRKFKSPDDVEELSLHDPGLADLPAISVAWGNVGTNWFTHVEQKWPGSLNVVFWLPADQIQIAEWRSQQLVECLFRAKPEGDSRTYLKIATGYPPEKYSQTIEAVELGRGQMKALRGTIACTLPATFNPYG